MYLLIIAILLALFSLGLFWRFKRARLQKQERTQQLLAWAARHKAMDPVLQQWILRLPADEAGVLLDLVNGYCTSLNWELDWLFAPQIAKAPVLKAALEDSVSAYANSILGSLQMAEDVDAYKAYLAFDRKPVARKQRTLVQHLYARIDEQNGTRSAKKVLGRFRSAKVTRQQKISAIRQAFEHDPAGAMVHLKETLASKVDMDIQQRQQIPTQIAQSLRAEEMA